MPSTRRNTIIAIPGFSPGDSVHQIQNRLGNPTQSTTINDYLTNVYEIVPNRVRVGYAYSQSNEVVQSEAAFLGGVDRLVMRTTLLGMLDGRSTKEIEQGLESVRTGAQDRFEFESRGFVGSISRNTYSHIHIVVRQ